MTDIIMEAPQNSEEELALKFAARHADQIRYVAKWGMWFEWDGKCWRQDETRKVFSLSRELCREVANGLNKPATRKSIASAKTRAAVASLSGEDRRLAATIDQWDVDPWLLNTPGGVVDLRTGKMRQHRADDYMTKITATSPDASCPTPLWNGFLDKVTQGDKDYKAYLRRMWGYALTGITREHAMFFLFGDGGNGKSVMVTTISEIMADYHRKAPIETFTEKGRDRHPTDLAMLRGARLVTAQETEKDRHWAESRINELTGGDKISARFMRQDFFEYVPQFKLVIFGNHKPGLRSVNEAIRRRLNLLPFTAKITDDEKDLEFANKLKMEWPGILAWMIAGCVEWQRRNLCPPKNIKDATKAYLEEEDTFGLFIDECCEKNPNEWTSVAHLFFSWKKWAEQSGTSVGSRKSFSQRLESNGFIPKRGTGGQRGFQGLTLFKDKEQQEAPVAPTGKELKAQEML